MDHPDKIANELDTAAQNTGHLIAGKIYEFIEIINKVKLYYPVLPERYTKHIKIVSKYVDSCLKHGSDVINSPGPSGSFGASNASWQSDASSKTAGTNNNNSKSKSEIRGCLAKMKDRSKPSQGGHLKNTTFSQAGQDHSVSSISPPTVMSPGQTWKVETFHNLAKELITNHNASRSAPRVPLRRKAKQGILAPAQDANYNQSRYPLETSSNMSMFSTKSDACCTSKSGPSKNAYLKQTASRNISDSKSTSEIYGSLTKMKNRNKPSQGGHLTRTAVAQAGQVHRVSSISPDAYLSPEETWKVETFHNLAKELITKDMRSAPCIPSRRKVKKGILAPAQHTNYNQSKFPLENNSTMSMFSTKSDFCCTSKSGPSKNAYLKQTASRNISDSKRPSEIYGCLTIMKNRNKPSQGGHLTKTTLATARQTDRISSVSPHASLSPGQVQKVETFHDLAMELFINDNSQAPSKSKPARTGGRKVSNHVDDCEKPHERVRQSDAPPSRGQWYVPSSHTFSKRILRAIEKEMETISSEVLIQRTMPKVRNKHHNHVSGGTTGIYKPHSMVATSSRSFP
ncbi:hypothetical protein BsWGS_17621 [Bradybaena similaris]